MAITIELGLWVDTTYAKCYVMENRFVLVVGVIWDIEIKLDAYLKATYMTNITIVDTHPYYNMLLSRQWTTAVGGNVQLDLLYATILVNGKEVKLYREPRSKHVIKHFEPNQMNYFYYVDLGSFKIENHNLSCKTQNKSIEKFSLMNMVYVKCILMAHVEKVGMEQE